MSDIIVNVEVTETGDTTEVLVADSTQVINVSVAESDVIVVTATEQYHDLIIGGGGAQTSQTLSPLRHQYCLWDKWYGGLEQLYLDTIVSPPTQGSHFHAIGFVEWACNQVGQKFIYQNEEWECIAPPPLFATPASEPTYYQRTNVPYIRRSNALLLGNSFYPSLWAEGWYTYVGDYYYYNGVIYRVMVEGNLPAIPDSNYYPLLYDVPSIVVTANGGSFWSGRGILAHCKVEGQWSLDEFDQPDPALADNVYMANSSIPDITESSLFEDGGRQPLVVCLQPSLRDSPKTFKCPGLNKSVQNVLYMLPPQHLIEPTRNFADDGWLLATSQYAYNNLTPKPPWLGGVNDIWSMTTDGSQDTYTFNLSTREFGTSSSTSFLTWGGDLTGADVYRLEYLNNYADLGDGYCAVASGIYNYSYVANRHYPWLLRTLGVQDNVMSDYWSGTDTRNPTIVDDCHRHKLHPTVITLPQSSYDIVDGQWADGRIIRLFGGDTSTNLPSGHQDGVCFYFTGQDVSNHTFTSDVNIWWQGSEATTKLVGSLWHKLLKATKVDNQWLLSTEFNGTGGAGGVWGGITGTLSDQTDLQTALNGKLGFGVNVFQNGTYFSFRDALDNYDPLSMSFGPNGTVDGFTHFYANEFLVIGVGTNPTIDFTGFSSYPWDSKFGVGVNTVPNGFNFIIRDAGDNADPLQITMGSNGGLDGTTVLRGNHVSIEGVGTSPVFDTSGFSTYPWIEKTTNFLPDSNTFALLDTYSTVYMFEVTTGTEGIRNGTIGLVTNQLNITGVTGPSAVPAMMNIADMSVLARMSLGKKFEVRDGYFNQAMFEVSNGPTQGYWDGYVKIACNNLSFSGVGTNPTLTFSGFDSVPWGEVDSVNGQTGAVVLDSEDVGADYLHGIETKGTMVWTDTAPDRTLTLTGISYYIAGRYYPANNASVQIADTVGQWYIYFDGDHLSIKASQTVFSLSSHALVATVNWNGTNGACSDERHGYRRDIEWHRWAHLTIGTRYGGGLSLTAPSVASPSTIDISSGSIWDEDIQSVIPQQTSCRIWYETAAGVWTWINSTTVYGTSVRYVDITDYSIQDVGTGEYINIWMYATNDVSVPIYCFFESVNSPYTTANAARAGIPPALSGVAITQELKLLYQIIMRGNDTFIEAIDYRNSSVLPAGGTASTNAAAVGVNASSFAGVLSPTDTTVQTALQTLDGHIHFAPRIRNITTHTSEDGSILAGSDVLLFSTGASNRTLTGMSNIEVGRELTVKKIDSGAGTVAFSGTSSCTIDGNAAYTLTLQYESITLVCTTSGADCVFSII